MRRLTGFLALIFLLCIGSITDASNNDSLSALPEIKNKLTQKHFTIAKTHEDSDRYSVEGKSYRAEFSEDGFTFIKKNRIRRKANAAYSFKYQPSSIKIGDKVLWELKDKLKLGVKDNKAIYPLTENIKEIYEPKKGGVEQSWEINKKPARLSELKSPEKTDLIIEGKIFTELKTKENEKRGIDFLNEKGKYAFSYGKVTVKDSNGRSLVVSPSLSSISEDTPSIRILVSAKWLSEAEYPVVIDPFIGDLFIGSAMLMGIDLTEGDQKNSSIVCGDKSCLTVFEDDRNDPNGDIYGQFFDFDTVEIKANRDDPALNRTLSRRHVLKSSGIGRITDGFYGSSKYIFYTGNFNFPISENTEVQTNPAIASNSEGTAYLVVWQEYNSSNSSYDIKGRLVKFSKKCDIGKQGAPYTGVEDFNDCIERNIQYYGVETWKDLTMLYNIDIYFADIDMASPEFSISSAGYDETDPAIAFDGTNFLVVWQEDPYTYGDGNHAIYGQRIQSDGVPFGSRIKIANIPFWDYTKPAVAFGNSKYLITMDGQYANPPFQNKSAIYGKFLDKEGTYLRTQWIDWYYEFDVSNSAIAFDGTNFLVTWQKKASGSSNNDIKGQFIHPINGGSYYPRINITSDPLDETNPALAFDGTNYLVVWSEDKKDILGSFVDTGGNVIKTVQIPDRTVSGSVTKPGIAFSNYYESTITQTYYPHYIATWTDSRAWYNADEFEGLDTDGASDGTNIYAQIIPPSGDFLNVINLPINVDNTKSGHFNRAAAGNNKHLVIWDNDKDDDGSREIYGQFIDIQTEELIGNNFVIATTDILNDNYWSYFPGGRKAPGYSYIAVAYANGKFMVVYEKCRNGICDPPGVRGTTKLALRVIDEQTGEVSVESTLVDPITFGYECTASPTAYGIAINITAGNDEFLIAWAHRNDTEGWGAAYGLFIDSNGNTIGSEFAISDKYDDYPYTYWDEDLQKDVTKIAQGRVCSRVYTTAYDSTNDQFLATWQGGEVSGMNGRLVKLDNSSVTFVNNTSGSDAQFNLVSGSDYPSGAYAVAYGSNKYLLTYRLDDPYVGHVRFFDPLGSPISSLIPVHGNLTPVAGFDGENFILHWENMSGFGYTETAFLLVTPEGIPVGSTSFGPGLGAPIGFATFITSDGRGNGICFPNVSSNGNKEIILSWPKNLHENSKREVYGFPFAYDSLNDIASYLDNDDDGIDADEDGSGTPGDNPCTGGNTANCDDNCLGLANSDQADSDGDGIGDVCDYCVDVPTRWSEEVLQPKVTTVKSSHIIELRNAVDSITGTANPWTDTAPCDVNAGTICADHIIELRTAVEAIPDIGAQSWTNDPIVAKETLIKGVHIFELRNALTKACVIFTNW